MAKVLNAAGSRPRGDVARRKPIELALELQRTMLRMRGEFMDSEGRGVDYERLHKSALFLEYVGLCGELTECDVASMEEVERKAFFISILIVYSACNLCGQGLWHGR